jgi:hypothetical protein
LVRGEGAWLGLADADASEPDPAAAGAAQQRLIVRRHEADDAPPLDGEEEGDGEASDRPEAEHRQAQDGAPIHREEVHREARAQEHRSEEHRAQGDLAAPDVCAEDLANARHVTPQGLEPKEALAKGAGRAAWWRAQGS